MQFAHFFSSAPPLQRGEFSAPAARKPFKRFCPTVISNHRAEATVLMRKNGKFKLRITLQCANWLKLRRMIIMPVFQESIQTGMKDTSLRDLSLLVPRDSARIIHHCL